MPESSPKSYILLTGASSGIGKAAALLLAKDYNLVLNGRDRKRLEETAELCSGQGHEIFTFPFDLVNAREVGEEVGKYIKEKNIEINAFVHCAGMTEVLPINKTRYHIGLEVMNVNYFSATEIISALLKKKFNNAALKNIILITSIAATQGAPHQPHYCASKGALEALRITLARDLAPKVRVNAVAPGSFQTRMWQTPLADDKADAWNPPTLLPPGDPDEVARAIRFLLSDESNYLTGVLLPVNGGELLYK